MLLTKTLLTHTRLFYTKCIVDRLNFMFMAQARQIFRASVEKMRFSQTYISCTELPKLWYRIQPSACFFTCSFRVLDTKFKIPQTLIFSCFTLISDAEYKFRIFRWFLFFLNVLNKPVARSWLIFVPFGPIKSQFVTLQTYCSHSQK